MNQLKFNVVPRILHFKQPTGTSRGIYTIRKVWYVECYNIDNPEVKGIGECAPLPQLSCDDYPNYGEILVKYCRIAEANNGYIDKEILRNFPSIQFGIETALRSLKMQSTTLWDTPFSRGEKGIQINGLIWMGTHDEMLRRIDEKLEAGFRCIKIKIGAINFDEELSLLKYVRQHYSSKELELRVDANCAFSSEEVIDKLNQLAEFDLHSVEQPVMAHQWDEMRRICDESPVPIALDEDLIGLNTFDEKETMLHVIRPKYIVIKPSLHGGICGAEEWIKEAEKRDIGWWITSALESNIGLNAIAQWCATFNNPLPQGLGTGMLYTDNIDMPLEIRKDSLWFNPAK